MDEQAERRREDSQSGRVLLQQYRLDTLIGEGGMGAVYRGQQLSVSRPVAVKLIAGKIAENPECVKRFRREAEAMAKLHHPNTVRLFDFGVAAEGELFMVMELLEGVDLSEHLTRRGRLPPAEALDITRQVLEALGEAHALGIIHRDLKPANIFLAQVHGSRRVAKVMDFGIAGIEQSASGTKLTMTGAVMGTPAYMSPEQAQGKLVDARSDLYSLGVVLFEMLTGKPPFEADSAVSMLLAQVTTPPPRLLESSPGLAHGAAFQAFLDALLDKSPERRPASAHAALARVDQLIRQLEPGAPPLALSLSAPAELGSRASPSGASPALAQNTFHAEPRASTSALPAPARRKWLVLSAVLVVAAAAVALAFRPGPHASLAPPAPAPGPASPLLPGAMVMYSVHVISKPSGAGVELAGVEIGKTPYTIQFRQPTALTLTLPGHVSKTLQVDAKTEPNLVVELEAVALAQAKNGSRRGKAERVDARGAPSEVPVAEAAPSEVPQAPASTPQAPVSAPPSTVVAATAAPLRAPVVAAGVTPTALPPPAWLNKPPVALSPRERREAMLRHGPPFRNVASAKRAYRSGQLGEDAYEDTIWVLKTQRSNRIAAEKLNYKRGVISRDEYDRRVRLIDTEYEGQ